MQAGVGLLVANVMPIYMIMPRYSHNYALFYQLLDSNLFTHRNTYAILREASSETYGPGVYFPSYMFPVYFILQSLLSNLYHKNTKNIYLIISIRSHFCKWSWRDWKPFYCVGCKALIFLCRYEVTHAWSPTRLIPWFSKTEEILTLLCCITLSSSRENQRMLKR